MIRFEQKRGCGFIIQKEVKVAKNSVKLLNLCWDKGLTQEEIYILVEPIRKAETIREKEDIALKLIEELQSDK